MANAVDDSTQAIKGLGEETLRPQDVRIFDSVSWLAAWIGSSIFIGAFMLGASLVPPVGKLNLFQAIVCLIFALTIVSICMVLNGKAGNKYGIPFVALARTSFGTKGALFPMALRAIPAICWYGIQSWIGALAINAISVELIGFDNKLLFFVIFQFFQVGLSVLGFRGLKWLENIGSVVIVASLGYMLYIIATVFGSQLSTGLIHIEGTWGMPFWAGTTVFIGVFSTWMINSSDYSREVLKYEKPNTSLFIIQWFGIVPPLFFMALIGLMAANITGEWDPIFLFVELLPNTFVLFVALFFVALAQVTTNVMGNVIPPAYVLMDTFKISYKKASIIVGILALFTFPWYLSSAGFFTLFIQFYSVFLGPIFAVMVTDYYFIRKQNLDLNAMYDKNGPYIGVNWCGIVAIAVGAGFALFHVDLSWYISLLPAALTYYFLMKQQIAKKGSFAHGSY
jgi:NCS1 family nucleobase:cation symporter-1